ncbi:MAG TPA: tetratricopeptide repeat protein [Pirellulales bacterium]|nr:tetratricopeptide repeat protein [Pirellulales bacterium]
MFLLVVVGLVFGQTLRHGLLIVDDSVFVYENPHVSAGLTGEGIRWAFTDGPYGEWYPLAMLSHMLDCQLYGLQPWGHHLTSVLIHAATAMALFLVLRAMTGEFWPSVLVAALFAVHPQRVESVAWVAERKDVLSGFFFVLTLAAYLGYVRQGRSIWRYLLVVVLFALGLMSKPMIVTLPAVLCLLDFWPLARFGAARDVPSSTASVPRPGVLRLVLEKLPLVVLAVGDSLVTLRTHRAEGVSFSLLERLGNGLLAVCTYLGQMIYPVGLAVFYPLSKAGQPTWKVVGAAAAVLLVSLALVLWRRRCPYGFVGWFWYLGMLSPVLGVFKFSANSLADRYTYLPSIGLAIAVVWGLARGMAVLKAPAWSGLACGGALVVGLTICAARQTSHWHDDFTLWNRAKACTARHGEVEAQLGAAFERTGRIDDAIACYYRAVELEGCYRPYCRLGLLLAKRGKVVEAMPLLRRAVEIEPGAFDAHLNLGLALAVQQQFDEATRQFQQAVEINPANANAHGGLAFVHMRRGELDAARAELERALEIDPRHAPAHVDLASVLLKLGQTGEAKAHFEAALTLDPNNRAAQAGLRRLERTATGQPSL